MNIFNDANLNLVVLFIVLSLIAAIIILLYLVRHYKTVLRGFRQVIIAGQDISSHIEMDKIISSIVNIAKQQIEAEACSLYFVDEENQELFFEVALGDNCHLVKELRFKINDNFIAGWVATYKKSLNIKNINKDLRFKDRLVIKNMGLIEKAFLTMPIINKNKLVGVLQFINKKDGRHFTKRDEKTMRLLIETLISPNIEKSQIYNQMRDLFVDSIETIANAIEAKDNYTQGHCARVSKYSIAIGMSLGLYGENVDTLRFAAILHDVGKIGVRDSILNSKSNLSDEEYEEMKSHSIKGAKILQKIVKTAPDVVYAVKYHHERYDGKGYPEGLSGDGIPLFARIIAVADTYDAMTSNRSYRNALSKEVAVEELKKCAGTQLDKKLVDIFLQYIQQESLI